MCIRDRYRDGVRSLVAVGKPVAITGFGACAYAGASDRGARAMEIVEYDEATQTPLRLDGEYTRDEAGHAADIREVLEISLIHISEPTRLGMISYAVFCLKKKKK